MSTSPAAFIRSRGDALIILVLWCLRTLTLLLLLVGWIVLVISRQLGDDLTSRLDSPGDVVSALTTPLAGVALAIVVRLVVAVLAWLSAAPLVTREVPPLVPTAGQSWWRQMTDRWRQVSGTASVRGTWAVRAAAIDMAGAWGPRLRLTDNLLRVLCVVTGVGFVVTTFLVGA